MKYLYLVLIVALIATSCDEEDERLDFLDDSANRIDQYYAWEEADAAEVTEGGSTTITLENIWTLSTEDVQVEIGISGTAAGDVGNGITITNKSVVEGFTFNDITISGNTISVVINNNDTLPSIDLELEIAVANNATTDTDQNLIFTINSVTRGGQALGVGDNDGELITKTVNIVDNPLEVSLSPGNVSSMENSKDSTTVSLSLNYATSEDVTLTLGTFGNLVETTDFVFEDFNTTMVISAGRTDTTFKIINRDDLMVKAGTDSLGVFISNATIGGSLSLTKSGMDSLVYFQTDDIKTMKLSGTESDTLQLGAISDAGVKIFRVNLDNVSTEMVEIDYDINPTNGVEGDDYTDLSGGTLVFNPGQTVAEIAVQVLADAFENVNDVTLEIALDHTSLNTGDGEVKVEAGQKTYIKVNN
ncbi:hypothetical protein FNH22_02480 [Fulvivirga sp. M361]|uniref:hypothetical protein n=1 Tax=Fulvivirga sp. M361 TaxID=2594266 RepID=UPI00117B032E|nr:hypothetical protein [Fulvivirga sp. M361]TRX62206.1 hypothetical protein FNH22_02480 [Fulvivirga sp. M361]